MSTNTSLNPFEIRASLKPDLVAVLTDTARLNPFEIRASLKPELACYKRDWIVLIPLKSGQA